MTQLAYKVISQYIFCDITLKIDSYRKVLKAIVSFSLAVGSDRTNVLSTDARKTSENCGVKTVKVTTGKTLKEGKHITSL
jgi:hypothetical protein